jgi:hypothetical protein
MGGMPTPTGASTEAVRNGIPGDHQSKHAQSRMAPQVACHTQNLVDAPCLRVAYITSNAHAHNRVLAMLYSFRKLRALDLRDTRETDEGVRHIKVLKGLQQLDIRGTQITDNGLQELRRALPHCDISR